MAPSVRDTEEEALIPKVRSRDRLHLVYVIIFCTGIGTLIPWNYFITAKQYFISKITPIHNETSYIDSDLFENYLSLSSMIPMAVTNVGNLFLRRYITPMRRFNIGVSTMVTTFLLTLVLTKISIKIDVFFWITMISVAILNVCSGLIQGSSMGIVSMMPSRFMKGFMEGQALSGILASASSIISTSLASDPSQSAFIYFFVAIIILIFAGFGFCTLEKINFSKEYILKSRILDSEYEVRINDDSLVENMESISLSKISFKQKYYPLFKRIIWYALSVSMSFLVTLSIFPSISSSIMSYSSNHSWKVTYFTPVSCFLLYNVGDYLGRFLCGFINFPSVNYPKTIFGVTLFRWIMVPLYFICNVQNKNNFHTYLTHDAYPIILTVILSVSNGYLITLNLVYAPSVVSENEKEAVGTLMSLFLCIGLSLGVFVSFLYKLII